MASSWVCRQQTDGSWDAICLPEKSSSVESKDKFSLEKTILKLMGLNFYTVAATNWSQTRPGTALYTIYRSIASTPRQKVTDNVTEQPTNLVSESKVKPNDSEEDDDDDIGIGSMFD